MSKPAPFEWRIGRRYLGATRGRSFVSFISAVSMAGLALGVAVLVVVLSVMNGFERELRTRILDVTSHVTLYGPDGRLRDWQDARAQAQAMAGVQAVTPFIESQALLARGAQVSGTQVRGVDFALESASDGLLGRLDDAELDRLQSTSFRIALGSGLAQRLGAELGSEVVVMAPEASATPAGLAPRMRRFTVAAIFSTGMYEYDSALALVRLADAARLFRHAESVSGLRLSLADPYLAPLVARELAERLGEGFGYSDWTRSHASFFSSIRMTKNLMFLILSLLVAIAAFNLLSTLVMVVKDKRTDIAMLRTLGASPGSILRVFLIQGSLIGLIGVLIGCIAGVALAWNITALVRWIERLSDTQFLDAKLYFIADLPARVMWSDVLQVGGVALGLCALATLYPAWRAARTLPAEALRHE